MHYFEAPKKLPGKQSLGHLQYKESVFLAGGITGCSDWQSIVVDKLSDTDLIVFNPRRADFDVNNKNLEVEQIEWEHYHMQQAKLISFWFDYREIQPIALFELGRWSSRELRKEIIVGCHPQYPRIRDVKIQLGLEGYCRPIVSSIDELVSGILWLTSEWKQEVN